MKQLLRSLSLVLLMLPLFFDFVAAQLVDRLNRPQITPEMPEWARMLYADPINVPALDSAFVAYYRVHPFEKNNYTKFYRRWRHRIEPYLQPDGSILRATPDELEARFRPASNAAQLLRADSRWSPIRMNTFWPGSDVVAPWQVNVYSFAIAPSNSNILVCATEPGGIFRTTDKGANWVQIGMDYELGSEALAIHPTNPATIYITTNGAIRKTTDAGATWSTIFTLADMWCYRIEILPTDPNLIVAATNKGIIRTTDAGVTWKTTLDAASSDVAIHPTTPSIIYALGYNEGAKRYEFWKSIDFGATFSIRSTGWYADTSDGGGRLSVTAADPGRIYGVLLTPKGPQVLRSNNEGESWRVIATGNSDSLKMNNGQGYYDFAVLASPTNADHLIVATTTAYKSTDGGEHFTPLGGYTGPFAIHPDIQDMRAFGGQTWIATDGGLTYSTDFFTNTDNAVARVNGLNGSDFWGFDAGWNSDVMVGGRYHNGNTATTENYNGRFLRMGGGEAATGYVNPIRANWTYYSDIGAYILPDTLSDKFISIPISKWPNESYFQMWYSRMVWDPRCYNTVWIGNGNTLWRSNNGGARYDSVFAVKDSTAWIEHIEIARSNPDVIYITEHNSAYYDAKVWRSRDAGATWDSLPPFPGTSRGERRQMKITMSGTDANELWAALANGNASNKVFHSRDGGATWENMTTTTIRDVSVSDIVHQLGTDGGVYIACNGGRMYYRNRAMSDWVSYNNGLWIGGYTRCLKPFYRDGKLRAGGNLGVWEIPLYEPSMPLAQPTVDKRITDCPRDTFYFDDYSVLRYDQQQRWAWEFPGASYVSSTTDRNPRVVYGAPGRYNVALTVSNALGTNRKEIAAMVEVGPSECGIDPRALSALDLSTTNDLATISPVPGLDTATSFTFSAWVKLAKTQASFSQIISNWSSNVGFSFGFSFQGYRANTNLTFYWRGVPYQLTSPFDLDTAVWVHVAITVEADKVTLYRNGESWVYAGDFTGFNFTGLPFELGGGLPGQGGNFQGEIEEVKLYNHALTQQKIRETMHLIHPSGENGLVAYYQFNESSQDRLYDGVGALHAANSGGGHVLSTAPVAVGTSSRIKVMDEGEKDFIGTGVRIRYEKSEPFPDDDVVAYRMMASPDTLPSATVNQLTGEYWIIRAWGKKRNATDTLILTDIGGITPHDSADVGKYFTLFARLPNEHRELWQPLPQRAIQKFATLQNSLWFEFTDGSLHEGQYIVATSGSSVLSTEKGDAANSASGTITAEPNPTTGRLTLRFRSGQAERTLRIVLSDILGHQINQWDISSEGDSPQAIPIDISTLPTGLYILRVNGRGILVVNR